MSYQVIARKSRPQVFDDVVGQQLVTDTLKNAIAQNRVAHGYIFSGARGVGKTTTARILAKALNCFEGVTVTPCGKCPSCQEIAAGNSVDVLEIDAASNRGIDEIRELRETVRYLPARDRTKVFIIDEAHMLTPEAFNALLKTLEESRVRKVLGIVPLRLLSEMVEAVHAADAARVLEQVSRIAAEGYELAYFCGELTRCVRNLVVVKSCGGESPLLQVPNDERKKLVELSGSFSEEDLARFFQILLRTEAEMRYSLEPRFHLELGLLKMVHARKLEPLEEVLSALRSKPAAEKGASGSSRGPASAAAPGPAKLAPGGSPPAGLDPRPAYTPYPRPAAPA